MAKKPLRGFHLLHFERWTALAMVQSRFGGRKVMPWWTVRKSNARPVGKAHQSSAQLSRLQYPRASALD